MVLLPIQVSELAFDNFPAKKEKQKTTTTKKNAFGENDNIPVIVVKIDTHIKNIVEIQFYPRTKFPYCRIAGTYIAECPNLKSP